MNLRSFLNTAALLILSGTALYAAPVVTLDVSFPSPNTETPNAICVTRDNGFVIGGTSVDSAGVKKGLLMKVDSEGKHAGKLFLYGTDMEVTGVVQSHDGSYVTCGHYNSGASSNIDWKIVKTDSTGKQRWSKTLGFAGIDKPGCIIQTSDSGFVVSGFASKTPGDTTSALIKLDKNGTVVWTRLCPSTWSVVRSVKQTDDGGFVLVGGVRGINAWRGGMDAFLLKVDYRGVQQWYQAYGGSGDEIGNAVDTTNDGGYVIAGSTTSYGNGLEDAFVLKADSVGKASWYKTYGGAGSDEALGVVSGNNNSTITFTGNMRSFSADSAAMVYQLSRKGDSLWSSRFQGFVSNTGVPLQKTSTNLFTLCYSHLEHGDTTIGMVVVSQKLIKIAAGASHSMFLKPDGTLWSCGDNSYGQLGDGTTTNRLTPVQVMSNVQDMATGEGHSLILKTDGTLWGCGNNSYGQLGNRTAQYHSTPVQVMSNVQDMAAGAWHSLILKTDGTLWSCGLNWVGQLGNGTNNTEPRPNPIPVQVMSNVQDIAAGLDFSLILKTDGTLWSCGANWRGQLGVVTPSTICSTPVQVMSNVQGIAAGSTHSLILKTDGTLWSCGDNSYGQLGYRTTINVQDMAAGYDHSLILKTDGTLWACGYNDFGQLGDGTTISRSTPVKILSGETNSFLFK